MDETKIDMEQVMCPIMEAFLTKPFPFTVELRSNYGKSLSDYNKLREITVGLL